MYWIVTHNMVPHSVACLCVRDSMILRLRTVIFVVVRVFVQ